MTFSYDFEDELEGGDFVTLSPGRYLFKFVRAESRDPSATAKTKKPLAHIFLQVVAGNPAFVGGMIDVNLPTDGPASHRFHSILRALGVKTKSKGRVQLEKYYGKEIGASVTLQEGSRPREDGSSIFFHELRNIVPGEQMADLLDGQGSEFEEPEDVEDEEAEEEEEISAEDLDDMNLSELKALAEEYGISTEPEEGKSKLSASAMRRRLADELFTDEEEEADEEEDEEAEDELSSEDLDDMGLAELKKLAEEYDVSVKPAKGKTKLSAATMRKRIRDELFDDEPDDDEEPF